MEMAFTPVQITALRDLMQTIMQNASNETAQSLSQNQAGLTSVMQQMTAQQEEMKVVMNDFDVDKSKIKEVMENFHSSSATMTATMSEIENKLGSLNLEAVDAKVGSLVAGLTEARSGAMDTLREIYGGKMEEMDSKFGKVDVTLTHAHDMVAKIEARVGQIEQGMQSGNFGGKGKGG